MQNVLTRPFLPTGMAEILHQDNVLGFTETTYAHQSMETPLKKQEAQQRCS
jgi:hypothetical protein